MAEDPPKNSDKEKHSWEDTTGHGTPALTIPMRQMRRKNDAKGETPQSLVNRIARTDDHVADLRADAKEVRNDVSDLRAEVHLIRKIIITLGSLGVLGEAGRYLAMMLGGGGP